MDVTVPESCGSPEMLKAAGTLSCATYCRELLWGGQSDRGSSRDVDCGSVTDFGCRAGGGAPRDCWADIPSPHGAAAAGRWQPLPAVPLLRTRRRRSIRGAARRLGAEWGGWGWARGGGAAPPPRPPPGHGSAPPARGRGRLARSFPAERRRPAACQPHLAPGGHLERPVGRDRRRGFLSFLEQLVIDFPGETSLRSGGPVTSHQPQPGRNRWGVNFGGEGTASLLCSLLSQSVQGWKRDGGGRV